LAIQDVFCRPQCAYRGAQPSTGDSSTMKKPFVLGLLLIGLPIFGATAARAQTQTIFIAQTAAGGNTGADCADALVYTFFNSVGNWAGSFTAGKISPGTTVEICGTITASAISTRLLAFQGPGTSGNPITLLFGPGASLQSPAFGSGDNSLGAILDGQSFTVIDGGGTGSVWNNGGASTFVPNGTILNTANGSGLANTQDSVAIWLSGSNITVQNMSIFNMYVHPANSTGLADSAGPQPNNSAWAIGCRPCTSGVKIQNNVFHDIATGVYEGYNTDNGTQYLGNEIYNVNHGIEVGNNGTSLTAQNILAMNNKIHDYANWDTTAGSYHHDGILTYAFGTGSAVTNFQVIGNMFYGNYGNTATAHLFLETGLVSVMVINNLFSDPGTCVPFGSFTCNVQFIEGVATTTNNMYNNTAIGPFATTTGATVQQTNVSQWNYENNVIVNSHLPLNLVNGSNTVVMTNFDFNVYGNFTGASFAQSHACAGTACATFAAWQAAISPFEAHSTFTNSNLNLSSNGSPGTSSPARNAGTNLTSLCGSLPALCSDIFGNSRPATGPWDAGAIQVSGSSGSVTIAPASYNFVTTVVGGSSSDSPATFTLTNNTGVTITGVTISFTGANPGDFTETTSCVTTLTSSASCQIFVTFTPTATGSRTATLSVSDSDASSPQTSSISGTAIPSSINPSPANPITFGVVVTDPSIPSTVKNEKQSENLSAYNFGHVILVGFLHQDRVRSAASPSASR
jgi:hypothetical protein